MMENDGKSDSPPPYDGNSIICFSFFFCAFPKRVRCDGQLYDFERESSELALDTESQQFP